MLCCIYQLGISCGVFIPLADKLDEHDVFGQIPRVCSHMIGPWTNMWSLDQILR